ncbi:MAG: hypothetical protein QOH60_1494 [Mycobacterium sp.]|nr:hypothetical protein [Mycobacterium sp.]
MALLLLTMFSSLVLGVVSALTAGVTLAATALIVPGTGTHNIGTVTGYKENAQLRFIGPSDPACDASCKLVGIDYPAVFWPLGFPPFPASWCPGLSCKTWNVSVGEGVQNLDDELMNQFDHPTPDNEQIDLFGYSQGGAVVSTELVKLNATLSEEEKARLHVTTIGNISNPQGLWARLNFLGYVPILNVTPGPILPTDGIASTNFVFEYDPVGDAPLWWGNPLALANAALALQYVHGNYLVPNSNSPDDQLAYGYTNDTLDTAIHDPANIRTYQNATFVLIPQQGTLPIYQPFVDLANSTGTSALVNPVLDLITPVTKVLINTAYDRAANPGIPQSLTLIPTWINPVTLTVDLVQATMQGVQNFVNDLGGVSTLTTQSTLAAPQKKASVTSTPNVTAKLDADGADKLKSATATQLAPAKPLTLAPNRPKLTLSDLLKPHQNQKKPEAATPPSKDSEPAKTPTTGATSTPAEESSPAGASPSASSSSASGAAA